MIDPRAHRVDEDSIVTLLSRAVSDAEQVARAEIDLQKARLLAGIADARSGVLLLLGALVTGSLALTGLVVGALLILTAAIGAIWATVIVVGILLIGAALLGWLGVRHFKAMFTPSTTLPDVVK